MSHREQRVINYRVKRACGFTCSADGCSEREGILVVHRGEVLTTRCKKHRGKMRPTAGQWIDRKPGSP